jgi:hypothetical protein
MDIWETNKLILFIAFVIPGFISMKVYGLLSPGDRDNSFKQVTDAVAYSCIDYALLSWAIYLIAANDTPVYLRAGFCLFALFIFPVILAYAWDRLRATKWFQARAPHPIGKPWDYVFGKHEPYWVIATLKDGTKIAGRYGGKSFTSSAPDREQIYLEETWVLNADGGFERAKGQTAGTIITSTEIASVELFKYVPEGGIS